MKLVYKSYIVLLSLGILIAQPAMYGKGSTTAFESVESYIESLGFIKSHENLQIWSHPNWHGLPVEMRLIDNIIRGGGDARVVVGESTIRQAHVNVVFAQVLQQIPGLRDDIVAEAITTVKHELRHVWQFTHTAYGRDVARYQWAWFWLRTHAWQKYASDLTESQLTKNGGLNLGPVFARLPPKIAATIGRMIGSRDDLLAGMLIGEIDAYAFSSHEHKRRWQVLRHHTFGPDPRKRIRALRAAQRLLPSDKYGNIRGSDTLKAAVRFLRRH